jgi:NADPH:quinone reductase-like Zn-dependent oxidoreductase
MLVRLSAAGINPFDWKVADGMLDGQVAHRLLVRAGGVALTTNYAASEQAMAQRRLRGGNFALTANPSLLERLGADTRSGFLKTAIEKQVPFAKAAAAVAAAKAGHARGKSVILIP